MTEHGYTRCGRGGPRRLGSLPARRAGLTKRRRSQWPRTYDGSPALSASTPLHFPLSRCPGSTPAPKVCSCRDYSGSILRSSLYCTSALSMRDTFVWLCEALRDTRYLDGSLIQETAHAASRATISGFCIQSQYNKDHILCICRALWSSPGGREEVEAALLAIQKRDKIYGKALPQSSRARHSTCPADLMCFCSRLRMAAGPCCGTLEQMV